jgi:argininosuccinate lyase
MNEIILFTSNEFELMKINRFYTTGGTAQPNLENPDTLEVLRANMAKFLPSAVQLIMIMDVLSSGYNRDSQQTKPILFESVEMMEKSLPVCAGILSTLEPNKEQMEKIADLNFSIAPSVAVELCIKGGTSFREAHKIVKTMIREVYLKKSFKEMTPSIIARASKNAIGRKISIKKGDISNFLSAKKCVMLQKSLGGPAPSQVKKMIKHLHRKVNSMKNVINEKAVIQKKAHDLLNREVENITGK